MKLKDEINRRKNLYLTLVAVGFAGLVVLAFTENYMSTIIYKAILYCSLVIFSAGNILLYIGIICPKCNSIIGYVIVFSAEKVVQCPRCKVMFDENILE
jgi:phage FluMu protein Com